MCGGSRPSTPDPAPIPPPPPPPAPPAENAKAPVTNAPNATRDSRKGKGKSSLRIRRDVNVAQPSGKTGLNIPQV